MLKHIGRHGDRKVAILFREVPNEEHMCLVVYPDVLPSHIHDSIMKTLESPVGQQATNLADALHRNFLPDGRVQLEALHREGMIKKVPSSQIIVTPNSTSNVKLDELNRLVREMETGQDAVARLQQLDESAGLVDPAVKRRAEADFKRGRAEAAAPTAAPLVAPQNGALDNRALAASMLTQAQRMEAEAQGMLAEAARMKQQAAELFPTESVVADSATAPVKTRGRKRQAVVENAAR